jgi:hypothetical protein
MGPVRCVPTYGVRTCSARRQSTLLRVCLIVWVTSESLSLLIQADFNLVELRLWHVFGSPCVLRNSGFIHCLVNCMY